MMQKLLNDFILRLGSNRLKVLQFSIAFLLLRGFIFSILTTKWKYKAQNPQL